MGTSFGRLKSEGRRRTISRRCGRKQKDQSLGKHEIEKV